MDVPAAAGGDRVGPEITVIAPTFNERDNVAELARRIGISLQGIDWELIFVDDRSPDGTAEAARDLARSDRRVRVLERIGRRGLSSASIEGMLSSAADFVAIIDADLQHDESLLPRMVDAARGGADLVIASRYADGGSTGAFAASRERISRVSGWLAGLVLKAESTDPMSGFFLIRRKLFARLAPALSGSGFKILVDILATLDGPVRIVELPYTFGRRLHGQSKLDSAVALEYAELLLDKTVGRFMPLRFVKFAAVGTTGLIVHLIVLRVALGSGSEFTTAQTMATAVAMTSNYFINNWFTYRDMRLRGWRMVAGLFSFYGVCALGAVANVGVGTLIYAREPNWWLAGAAGAIVGAVWNYAVSSVYTWRRDRI
jgi:dolichol-phosphate mannosyltransferase